MDRRPRSRSPQVPAHRHRPADLVRADRVGRSTRGEQEPLRRRHLLRGRGLRDRSRRGAAPHLQRAGRDDRRGRTRRLVHRRGRVHAGSRSRVHRDRSVRARGDRAQLRERGCARSQRGSGPGARCRGHAVDTGGQQMPASAAWPTSTRPAHHHAASAGSRRTWSASKRSSASTPTPGRSRWCCPVSSTSSATRRSKAIVETLRGVPTCTRSWSASTGPSGARTSTRCGRPSRAFRTLDGRGATS